MKKKDIISSGKFSIGNIIKNLFILLSSSYNNLESFFKKNTFLRKSISWIAAAAFLFYLFKGIDTKMFFDSLYHAELVTYLFWLVIFGISAFILDAQNIYSVVCTFNHKTSFDRILKIRGVSYLFMIINYNVGIGSIVYYLKKDTNISLIRSSALMLVYNSATQNCLAIIAGIGCYFHSFSSQIIQQIFFICLSVVTFSIVIISILKVLPEKGKIKTFKNLEIIKVYHEASWKSYCKIVFFRGVYYSTFVIFYYLAVRAFNMNIPITDLIIYVPIILLIVSLPITPFGLGTSQAAMLLFFKDYGSSENILAFGLVYSTSVILIRGFIGLFYLLNVHEWLFTKTKKIIYGEIL